MGEDDVRPASAAREHLVWHQELICPGEICRGRVRRFPPGELIDDGRRERRRCPVCGTSTTAPAFYVVRGARGTCAAGHQDQDTENRVCRGPLTGH